ncbi:MAG: hypothetical protein EXS13_03230 [Planctomycetes bacterium]|nr:hypothetical protein [Planctomycetota bacterium]
MTRRLLILTRHPTLHAPRRIADAAHELGFEVTFVVPESSPPPAGIVRGALLLARPGTFSLRAVLLAWRRLVAAGAIPLQRRRSLWTACDQWQTLCSAARTGVAFPPTRLIREPGQLAEALAAVGGSSWYVKGRRGSQGSHVVRVTSAKDAIVQCHLFWGTGQSALLQADRSGVGSIERHLVSAGRVLASVRSEPRPGEHRSNAHRGGRFVALAPVEATAASLALAAVAAVDLPFAAVDAIGGANPELLEVNASPGLEAIEAVTTRDLAEKLLAPWLLPGRLEWPAPASRGQCGP